MPPLRLPLRPTNLFNRAQAAREVDPRPLAQQCAEDNPREAYYAVVEEFCSTNTKDVAAVAEVLTHFQTGVGLSWLDWQ